MYATCHDPKIYPHTKFGIPTSNYIQICSGLNLARTETRGQGHIDLKPVGDSPGRKMYLNTKYGTATINNIGDLLWVQSQQQQNHRLRTDSSLSHRGGGGGLNAFYWYQIFALDSAVVEVQEMLSSHGGLLTNAIDHHGETL